MAAAAASTLHDLPDVILSNIIAAVRDVRSRNCSALVCHKWYLLERATRSTLSLRGNHRDLFMLPTCFPSISHLDLSLLSPWGLPLTSASDPDPSLIGHLLRHAFPSITSLTLYARNPSTIKLIAPQWPNLESIKLVRWHQRPQTDDAGEELKILISECVKHVKSLDLSAFYCWTDDVPPALEAYPSFASNLTSLNLLNPSFSEGFKSQEISEITKACPNLKEFKAACMFDPRYIGFVGDEALVSISVNCPKLAILHLADTSALSSARIETDPNEPTREDAKINVATLIEVFSKLPLLEDLAIDVCNNVRDSGPALEVLKSKCPSLRSLKLGQFHGISLPVDSKLDGVALCQRLESLSIRDVDDLTDMGLIAIGRGCFRLSKFEVHGCQKITVRGLRTMASLLRRTLVDVRISGCKNLGAVQSLKALEPIQDRVERLHIDCVWDCTVEELEGINDVDSFDLNGFDQGDVSNSDNGYDGSGNPSKKRKFSFDLNGNNGYGEKTWDRLEYLSLWIAVGQLLNPLVSAGLENCPNLEEIKIKVEGDCRLLRKPTVREFGLSTLVSYPKLSKMHLDCGDTIGYAHTAPSGHMDLSLWERFYLIGLSHLGLKELDYWPPQDRDVNQRSLSLPAAGLLQECFNLRKLIIHGTAHEHFMMFLLRIPSLRDVQLREDYYPAPENDMSTEMRADSCSRFEAALNRRQISD
ncbi:F-box/LRR-repeat MAX2 A [Castilleja foliolosa]|uniref:F-box/LRR-repeat MAX2 A n=1 Tax=Castilleja foliolosa TaxID=1961234 RepID=A0ABD3CQH4_9LAMI